MFFVEVVSTVQKISKDCVMHLSERKVQFILAAELTEGGVQVWSGIDSVSLFDDYKIESLNNNEVAFEINLEHLQRALKSAQNAQNIIVKLTKKNQTPFLSLAIEVQNNQHLMTIIQDVPIVLLSAQQLAQYIEPHLPDPEVHIMMPPLKVLRHVIDKMKNVSDHLLIEANMAGELTFRVETEMVSIATFYRNLEHPQIEGRSPPRQNPEQKAEVKVDIKKFHKFLFSYQVKPTNVICCTFSPFCTV
jgi:HUS1 checkpoint protein